MQKLYRITLTNGVERLVTRQEADGKSIIGLWIWSKKKHLTDVMLDFNECVVVAEHVMMIDRPEDIVAIDNEQDCMFVQPETNSNLPHWLVAPEGSVKEKEE